MLVYPASYSRIFTKTSHVYDATSIDDASPPCYEHLNSTPKVSQMNSPTMPLKRPRLSPVGVSKADRLTEIIKAHTIPKQLPWTTEDVFEPLIDVDLDPSYNRRAMREIVVEKATFREDIAILAEKMEFFRPYLSGDWPEQKINIGIDSMSFAYLIAFVNEPFSGMAPNMLDKVSRVADFLGYKNFEAERHIVYLRERFLRSALAPDLLSLCLHLTAHGQPISKMRPFFDHLKSNQEFPSKDFVFRVRLVAHVRDALHNHAARELASRLSSLALGCAPVQTIFGLPGELHFGPSFVIDAAETCLDNRLLRKTILSRGLDYYPQCSVIMAQMREFSSLDFAVEFVKRHEDLDYPFYHGNTENADVADLYQDLSVAKQSIVEALSFYQDTPRKLTEAGILLMDNSPIELVVDCLSQACRLTRNCAKDWLSISQFLDTEVVECTGSSFIPDRLVGEPPKEQMGPWEPIFKALHCPDVSSDTLEFYHFLVDQNQGAAHFTMENVQGAIKAILHASPRFTPKQTTTSLADTLCLFCDWVHEHLTEWPSQGGKDWKRPTEVKVPREIAEQGNALQTMVGQRLAVLPHHKLPDIRYCHSHCLERITHWQVVDEVHSPLWSGA